MARERDRELRRRRHRREKRLKVRQRAARVAGITKKKTEKSRKATSEK